MINERAPLVSVVISAFNAEGYISAAINSVLAQSYGNFEILVMDDGSTDGTSSILQKFALKDRRIHLFSQINRGITYSLNHLIHLSQGEFIARLDADDVSYPDRFAKQVNYLLSHPQVGLVSTWVQNVTSEGLTINCLCYPDDHGWISKVLDEGRNPFAHSSVMLRGDLLRSILGPYRFHSSQDFDLWLRLLPFTMFAIVPEVLVAVRQHPSSLSATNHARRLQIHKLIHDLYLDRKLGISDENWKEREEKLLSSIRKNSNAINENFNGASYYKGLAMQMNGNQKEARKAFRESWSTPMRFKAMLRYCLSLLPTEIIESLIIYNNKRHRRYGSLLEYSCLLSKAVDRQEQRDMELFWKKIHGA